MTFSEIKMFLRTFVFRQYGNDSKYFNLNHDLGDILVEKSFRHDLIFYKTLLQGIHFYSFQIF